MGDLRNLELPLGGNLYSFCSVDGNHSQHPAGDHDPYGILCLQAHSAMTAEQQFFHECLGTDSFVLRTGQWRSWNPNFPAWKCALVWTVGKW